MKKISDVSEIDKGRDYPKRWILTPFSYGFSPEESPSKIQNVHSYNNFIPVVSVRLSSVLFQAQFSNSCVETGVPLFAEIFAVFVIVLLRVYVYAIY
jgi:hypothetical protein